VREIVERFYANFNNGDLEAAVQDFAPDVHTLEPSAGEMVGRDAWRQFGETFKRALPDARLELVSILESGDRAAVEGRFAGTHTGPLVSPQGEVPPSGNAVDMPYADFFEVRDGQVVEHHVYYDQVVMLTQLGMMQAPTAAAPTATPTV